jgi:ketosteroid isomerase-like protein
LERPETIDVYIFDGLAGKLMETTKKQTILPIICSCWIVLAGLFQPAFSQARSRLSVEDHIPPLLAEQMLAANAHDTDRFLATYVHSPDLIFIANGKIIRGWDGLRDQQLKWWRNGKSDVVYTRQTQPGIMSLDPQTVLVTEEIAAHRTSPDGKPSTGTFIVTTIWRHLPVGWRVMYGHEPWAR